MTSRNLDIRSLRTFLTVVRYSSMVRAANALHLTQGAVSQQIKQLETKMNLQLFDRSGRSLMITEDGERFLEMATEIVKLNDRAWAEMTESKQRPSIRIGIPFDLVSYFMSSILSAYSQQRPDVETILLCASSPELREKVNNNEVDLAIIQEPHGIADGDLLATDQIVWLGNIKGKACRERPLNVSLVAESCAFREDVFSELEKHNIPYKSIFNNGNIDATLAAVSSDMAVTAWLKSCIPHDQNLQPISFGLPKLPRFSLKLYTSSNSKPSLKKELSSYIEAAFSSKGEDEDLPEDHTSELATPAV